MFFECVDRRSNQSKSADTGPEADYSPTRDALYGDGFFTTGRVLNGRIDAIEHHLQRITLSLQRLHFSALPLQTLADHLAQSFCDIDRAAFRLSITRRQHARGYAVSSDAKAIVYLQIFDLPTPPHQACELVIAKTPASVNPLLAGIKHLSRLDNVLAATELTSPYQEALMFCGDQLIGGSRSNVFFQIDSQWLTPKLDQAGILGITRDRVIKRLARQKLQVIETRISRSQLLEVNAAFVTNCLLGVWPAEQLANRSLDLKVAESIQHDFNRHY